MAATVGSRATEASVAKGFYLPALALLIAYFGFISFLYGQSYSPNPSSIVIHVVDLDGGAIGTALTTAVTTLVQDAQAAGTLIPAFTIISAVSLDEVVSGVNNGDAWGAIVANPSASSSLQAAIGSAVAATSGNATDAVAVGATARSYNASTALTILFDEGRQAQVASSAVAGPLRTIAARFSAQYAAAQVMRVGALRSLVGTQYGTLVTNPVGYTEINLHPSYAPVLNLGVALGNTFLMIFSILATSFLMGATQTADIWKEYNPFGMIVLRIRLILPYALVLPLLSTVVLTIFGVRWESAASFVSTWFLQVLTVLSHISLFSVIFTIPKVGLPRILMALGIVLVIFNVVGGLAVIDLAPPFYKFGWAFPIYNTAAALRTLVFGSYDHLGVNIGVLCAWVGTFSLIDLIVVLSGFEKTKILLHMPTSVSPDDEKTEVEDA